MCDIIKPEEDRKATRMERRFTSSLGAIALLPRGSALSLLRFL